MSDRYEEVTLTVLLVREKSIKVECPADLSEVWIGRSCIHGADERTLDDLDVPADVTLRIFDWLVKKENLA